MTNLKYSGFFPYPEFRQFQEQMLDKVKDAVLKGHHTVLMIDAPTGIGKTSTIAPILANRGDKKFIVAVETNTQIEIYLKEINAIHSKTNKKPTISYIIGKEKTCKLSVKRNVCDFLVDNTKKFIEYRINKLQLEVYDAYLDKYVFELIEKMSEIKEPINMGHLIDDKEFNLSQNHKELLICPYFLLSKIGRFNTQGKIEFLKSSLIENKAQEFLNNPVLPNQVKKNISEVCPYELMSFTAKNSDITILMHAHILQESIPIYLKLGIKPEDTILLIDEAHNFGDRAEQMNSEKIDLNLIKDSIKQIEEYYDFNWNNIHEKDKLKLLNYLHDNFNLIWKITPEIKKLDHDNTILISTENNSVLIKLNNDKTKAVITIDEEQISKHLIENDNLKLKVFNTYYNDTELDRGLSGNLYNLLLNIKNILEKLQKNAALEGFFDADLLFNNIFKKNIDSNVIKDNISKMFVFNEKISKIDSPDSDYENKPLYKIARFLDIVYDYYYNRNNQYVLRKVKCSEDNNKQIFLEIKNFDPSPIISKIVDVHQTTIMMSGTFSPINFYELYYFGKDGRAEKCSFPNSFPIQNRLIIGLNDIDTTFNKRKDSTTLKNYHKCMDSFIGNISGNVALFFTSYKMKKQYNKYCLELANKAGKEFFEQNNGFSEDEIFEKFKKSGGQKGGVLLAISGGKFSEGKDYNGDSLKAAMVIGFPLGQYDKIQDLKNDYYKGKYGEEKGDFIAYKLSAMNKALQALGRVIRAKDETGILILADRRFTKERNDSIWSFLPSWIQNEMIVCSSEQMSDRIEEWYRNRDDFETDLYKKGNEQFKLKKYHEAIEIYKKALEINPTNKKTLNNMANAFFNLNEYNVALKYYDKAFVLDSSNELILKNRKNALSKMKKHSAK